LLELRDLSVEGEQGKGQRVPVDRILRSAHHADPYPVFCFNVN